MIKRVTTRKVNWLVFYNKETDKFEAIKDDHRGSWVDAPEHLIFVGNPVANSDVDAINYISQILTDERIKQWTVK